MEFSGNTFTPNDSTKVPAVQGSSGGNFQLDALKAYILSQAGLANGLATLDENGKLDSSQIPVNLDDVLVYASYASLPATGETGKLYITMDVNGSYYWNGTSYQPLGNKAANYRGTVSTLPSNPHNADWFIAKTTFTDGGVTYTAGHIYLYDEAGAKWDDETNNFGQFVLKSQISQTIGNEADLIPSNAAVNSAINAIKVSSFTKLIENRYSSGVSSWQHAEDIFDTSYKKYAIFCGCVGATKQIIFFTKDELDTLFSDSVIACSAYWDSVTMSVAYIDSNKKFSSDIKSGSLDCIAILYGMN